MYLGFDTSNYTTSVCALVDGKVYQSKKLLSVKQGERGLRQSDAVFQHTVNMPELVRQIESFTGKGVAVDAVGVSTRPRNIDGSYMPCFLVGINTAEAVSTFTNAPLYKTSHQVGHILAALYSVERLDLINERFIAFHVSGGTTEALLVQPDKDEVIRAQIIAQSLDLKAGQAIDRTGVMLGLEFPCGKALDKMSLECDKDFRHRTTFKGLDCSLSGIENKVKNMVADGADHNEISKFVITYIADTIDVMTEKIIDAFGKLPLVYAGGVMSNSIISRQIGNKYDNAYFAKPQFSCDNAVGTAIYAYLKDSK